MYVTAKQTTEASVPDLQSAGLSGDVDLKYLGSVYKISGSCAKFLEYICIRRMIREWKVRDK